MDVKSSKPAGTLLPPGTQEASLPPPGASEQSLPPAPANTVAPPAADSFTSVTPQAATPSAPAIAAAHAPEATPAAAHPDAPGATPSQSYTIQSGDTLSGIAKRFNTTVPTLVADNKIANPNAISVGQKLVISGKVIVKMDAGDSLATVAKRFSTSVSALATANGIADPSKVKPGAQLLLPNARLYTVKKGDTLSAIAKANGSSVDAIALASNLANPNALSVGQQLVIVKATLPPPPPPPDPNKGEPAVMTEHKGQVTYGTVTGTLEVNGVSADDIAQGQAGDCYLLAALSSIAKQNPKVIENAIHQKPDGTYTVRFYEDKKPVDVTIDGKLPKDRWGSLEYASGTNHSELWPALIEKAYAKWKGGYDAIGNGGWPADALSQISNRPADSVYLPDHSKDAFAKLKATLDKGGFVCASTQDESSKVLKGTNIVGNHAYAVLDAEVRNGKQMVQVRNPWGFQEQGNDGKEDGDFWLPMADFQKYFWSYDHA